MPPLLKRGLWIALFLVVIRGGVKCISFLQDDTWRATKEIKRGADK